MSNNNLREELFYKMVHFPKEGYSTTSTSPTVGSDGSVLDMDEVYQLCSKGIPNQPSLRPTLWKVLLNYLPEDKKLWLSCLKEKRSLYYQFVTDICGKLNLTFPLKEQDKVNNRKYGSDLGKEFPVGFGLDCKLLEQIDIDVRRTLSDHTFFQTRVTTTTTTTPTNTPSTSCFPDRVVTEEATDTVPRHSLTPFDKVKRDDRRAIFNQLSSPKLNQLNPHHRSKSYLGLVSSKGSNTHLPSTSTSDSSLSSLYDLALTPNSHSNHSSPTSLNQALNLNYSPFDNYYHWTSPSNLPTPLLDSQPNLEDAEEEEDSIKELHFEAMERILFIYAKLNPGVGYVQGMNDLLGPIYYVLANDSSNPDPLDGKNHCEADAFYLFTTVMASVRDQFVPQLDRDTQVGVQATLDRLMHKLNQVAPELHQDLQAKGLDPTYYAFRWITVLGSHEFDLPNTIQLWDRLFSKLPLYHFSENGLPSETTGSSTPSPSNTMTMVGVAMLCLLQRQLLAGSFSENLQLLQNFPKTFSVEEVVELAYKLESLPPDTHLHFEHFIQGAPLPPKTTSNPVPLKNKFQFSFFQSKSDGSISERLFQPTKTKLNGISFTHRLVKSLDSTKTFLQTTHKLNHGY